MTIHYDTVIAMYYSVPRPGSFTCGWYFGKIGACFNRMAQLDLHVEHVRFEKDGVTMEGRRWYRRLCRVLNHHAVIDLSTPGSFRCKGVR